MAKSCPTPKRREMREGVILGSLCISADLHARLRALSEKTGKPIRWHVERAITDHLGVSSFCYRSRNFEDLAVAFLHELEGGVKISEAAERFREYCHEKYVRRPDRGVARRILRHAAVSHPVSRPEFLDIRVVSVFEPWEDRLIEAMRVEGRSLSEIGKRVGRHANVVLRRLNRLAEIAEAEMDVA